jgi:outer membrane lipoprotein carrier protein
MKVLISIFLFLNILLANNNIRTYQASFIQVITNPSGKKINYTGTVYIKQPNKMVWRYKIPIKKYVYMNNTDIIIDEPELEQAIFTTLNDEINLIELLNNPKNIDKKYKLIFNEKILTKIQYQDNLDNNVIILFTNIKINKKILDNIFHFNAPNNYDIIKK